MILNRILYALAGLTSSGSSRSEQETLKALKKVAGEVIEENERLKKVLTRIKKEKSEGEKFFFIERDSWNQKEYGCSAPLAGSLIFINPMLVKKALRAKNSRRRESGMIKDGDWDLGAFEIEKLEKVFGVKQRILNHVPWDRTRAWKQSIKLMKRQSGADGLYNMNDVSERYDKLEKFITEVRQFREAAYKTRSEINPHGFRETHDSIMMNISRNGELIFGDRGCHRLAIAQAFNLICIPAQIGMVHKNAVENNLWQLNLIPKEQANSIRLLARSLIKGVNET